MSTLSQLAAVWCAALTDGVRRAPTRLIPEMQRQVVDVHHWMSAQAFAALYALAQAAPGPNMMVVSLIGLRSWRFLGRVDHDRGSRRAVLGS